jgi:hypothetical protein
VKKIPVMLMMLSLAGANLAALAAEPVPPPAVDAAKAEVGQQVKPPASASSERVELGTTQITGNRELPRVLYVVPWKRADLGDPGGKPAKTLLDEVLSPVDRDVFRRQNRYHEALQPDAAAVKAATDKDDRGVER